MIDNNKLPDKWSESEEGKKGLDSLKPFWKAHENESDRAVAIVTAILLDNLLEQLIKTSYVKDPNVNTIFKDEHVLRSFYAKTNIAYFSGLIPKDVHHDLKLICDIRNKFAHDVVAELKFDDDRIAQRINQFSQISEDLVKIYPPRLRFTLNVSHIAALLLVWRQLLSKLKPPSLVETLGVKEKQFMKCILTPEQLQNILESKGKNPR